MIQPTRGKLLAEIVSEEEISAGGIVMAKYLKETPVKARVLAVGAPAYDYKKNKELPQVAKVGDTVHFKRYHGKGWITVDGKKYIFLKRMDVTAVERGKQ